MILYNNGIVIQDRNHETVVFVPNLHYKYIPPLKAKQYKGIARYITWPLVLENDDPISKSLTKEARISGSV